ncbi:MAG TPA: ACP S-malonyltransferase [Gammaproteobacteria bacterium]|nr:ACP S-malonyltransferase [Gammaproteobacteria bacterium]
MSFAIVFPGQGSQSIGMLSAAAQHYPIVRETFAEASEALGWDLWGLTQTGPEAELNRTERTQPALLAASVALWRAWRERQPQVPAAMAGHSLGEYSALVCADAMAFGDAVRLVARRGQLMQQAVPEGEGAMAAIVGLADDEVSELCSRMAQGAVLEPVNFNAPGQVVIAGARHAVERAVGAAKESGAKLARMLTVSVPAHSSLMRAAADEFEGTLRAVSIRPPAVPVIHNLDAAPHAEAQAIREALVAQLYHPVRWTQSMQRMIRDGAELFIECGPGKVLCGLLRRIDRRVRGLPLSEPNDMDAALAALEKG